MKAHLQAFNCHGLRIPLPGKWQLEFWFCPKDSFIPWHIHETVDGRLVFLGGRMVWQLGSKSRVFSWKDIGRSFAVNRNEPHSARVVGWFGLFLNIEKWFGEKSSASVDLVLTP